MNFFSVCFLGVLFLGLHNLCMAALVTFTESRDIAKIYVENKKDNVHLGHLATLTEEERLQACNNLNPRNDWIKEKINPHIFDLEIPENLIPKPEKPKPEESKAGTSKPGASKPAPVVIYNKDVAFRCVTADPDDQESVLSYGFAPDMFFVSIPVAGENNMKLLGFMYSPPEKEQISMEDLEKKFYELRERTENVRHQSENLMKDIEDHDDISALTNYEKKILGASILELKYYKDKGYKFSPIQETAYLKYTTVEVSFRSKELESKKFKTDCLLLYVVNSNNNSDLVFLGVTRSYGEGGVVYTVIKDGDKHYIDIQVNKIAVLVNRKFAGELEGTLQPI